MRSAVALCLLSSLALAQGRGVPQSGYPTWGERMLLVYTNRSRADPQADLAGCAANVCGEKACYPGPVPALPYNYGLSRSARFHSTNLRLTGCFHHESPCTLLSDLSSRWEPNGTCDGSPACACNGGTFACSTPSGCGSAGCTDPFVRMSLFGGNGSGENIAYGYTDPRSTFYQWLWEPDSSTACGFRLSNGHRANILDGSHGSLGVGNSQSHWTQDFGATALAPGTLVAGGHEPQFLSGGSTEFRVNYYDPRGPPGEAKLDVDGTCTPMNVERGTGGNATYLLASSLPSGACHRYYFRFKDPAGAIVRLPENGSYGVGPNATCADWDPAAPSDCAPAANQPPTIASAATASPNPTAGTSTTLSVLGADDDGEQNLVYAWSQTSGPGTASFSANGTNAAKSVTATFAAPGTFGLSVSATDSKGLQATSAVSVVVQRVAAQVQVSPPAVTIAPSTTTQFTATVVDQFHQPFANAPLSWSVSAGGTIANDGTFTANATPGGPYRVTAQSGSISGTAFVSLSSGPPDTTAPSVVISAPGDGTQVTGIITIAATASDDIGVAKVQFFADDAFVGDSDSPPYQSAWNAGASGGGPHRLRARAIDYAGNTADHEISVAVPGGPAPDGGPRPAASLSVRISWPRDGANLGGSTEVDADATGAVKVSFLIDGAEFGVANASPWTASLDAKGLSSGAHSLTAVASAADGTTATSAAVTVFASGEGQGGCHCGAVDGGGVLALLLLSRAFKRRR